MNDDPHTLRRMLESCRTIAVVGLSDQPHRASHGVARYLQQQGYRVIPVNPRCEQVLGEKSYARLEDIAEPVDMVDVFRRGEEIGPVVDGAIAIGAKYLWLQLGVFNDAAVAKAREAGLEVVVDRCVKIEHAGLGIARR